MDIRITGFRKDTVEPKDISYALCPVPRRFATGDEGNVCGKSFAASRGAGGSEELQQLARGST